MQWFGGLNKGYGDKAVGDSSVLTDLINPTLSLLSSPHLIIYLFSKQNIVDSLLEDSE